MQIRLFEDSEEIQLRLKETHQPDAVPTASKRKKHIILSYSHEIQPGYTQEYIKDICFHRITKYYCKTPLVFNSL